MEHDALLVFLGGAGLLALAGLVRMLPGSRLAMASSPDGARARLPGSGPEGARPPLRGSQDRD